MLKHITKTKLRYFVCFVLGLFFSLLINQGSCFAALNQQGITDKQRDMFSTNGIKFYNPGECMTKGGANATSCFKVDTSTEASESWYAEGCIDNGECTSGIYAAGTGVAFTNASSPNHFLMSDTKVDPDLGGLQYIYAENYDIEFDAYEGWIATFKPNGGNSQTKYYWIVLPDKAYTTAFGETYVATFEKSSEPIYFIVYDAHACPHQSQHYCERAEADPDGVAIGPEFLGAFSQAGGNYSGAVEKLGKLQTFCRITKNGDVLARENGVGSSSTTASGGSSSNTETSAKSSVKPKNTGTNVSLNATSNESGSDSSGSQEKCAKLGELRKKMWDEASQSDKESFMQVVVEEVGDIGGVEIYMNQVVAKHGSDGTLHDWLTRQCPAYRGGLSCSKSHTITSEEQSWIDEALAGSNHVKFAIGNATGGSGVGAGKIVCVWDGRKCRDDVDYSAQDGQGVCSVYSPSAGFGECLGMEGKDNWADEFKDSCGSSCNSFEGDYPQYYQGNYEASDHENSDRDWTGISYDGGTVADSGCGPTSMAMLATVAAGQDIYPQDVIDITSPTGNYVYMSPTELDPKVGEKYGFEVIGESYSSKSDAYNKMKDYLERGYMIHLSGEGYFEGLSSYATAGHYIGIFGIEGDDVYIANSAVENSKRSLQSVADFIHNGVFVAIKGGNGGSSSNCYDYCSNSGSTSVGEEGLTEEQAKTFMMNYGTNKNGSSANAVGALWDFCNGGGSNCVTFSAFFMFKFTNITQNGPTGNGEEVVGVLQSRSDVDATYGTDPKVWAILSTPPRHTAVVLGHHDGKWIVGHASCSYDGIGTGNGGNGNLEGDNKGGGSGFIAIEESDNPADWQWVNEGVSFAYPSQVYTDKIEEYLENGT